jgi:DNA mismatch repair protein MutL
MTGGTAMGRIHLLDEITANSIAAGEVVERPASVVKELCENAIDAGASVLVVEIRNGGVALISVSDNGVGMDPEDALAAFGRHATSKISTIDDLDNIATLGFRGEALASISAVSKVTLTTRRIESDTGTLVRYEGGHLLQHSQTGCPEGTRIVVENLFFNTPARFKFLKKDSTEASQVSDVLGRMALACPGVSFRLVSNGVEVLHSPGNNDLKSAIFSVYGRETAESLVPIDSSDSVVHVSGFVGQPSFARKSRQTQTLFVNGRLVRSKSVTSAIDRAFDTLLMKDRFAFSVLSLGVPPNLVDVNVHPQKMEVRFWNDGEVFSAVHGAIRKALLAGIHIPQGQKGREEASPSSDPIPSPSRTPLYDQVPITPIHVKETDSFPSSPLQFPVGTTNVSGKEPSAGSTRPTSSMSNPIQPPRIEHLKDARFVGRLFQTYLVLELGEDLLLVDQHAAHERILYERLVQRFDRHETISQPLLEPLVIEMSPSDLSIAMDSEEVLKGLGFDFESFGPHSLMLRTVPVPYRALEPKAAFLAAVDGLEGATPSDPESIHELLHTVACKAAVKAHDSLDDREAEALLKDLQVIENPYTCPHGRPVIIRIPKHELEKRFKRIV